MSILQFGNRPKKFVFVHQTTSHYFCARLTDNSNLAVELAMASTASSVGIENSPFEMKEMHVEFVYLSLHLNMPARASQDLCG